MSWSSVAKSVLIAVLKSPILYHPLYTKQINVSLGLGFSGFSVKRLFRLVDGSEIDPWRYKNTMVDTNDGQGPAVNNPALDRSHSDLNFVQEDEVLIASRGEGFKHKDFSKALTQPRKDFLQSNVKAIGKLDESKQELEPEVSSFPTDKQSGSLKLNKVDLQTHGPSFPKSPRFAEVLIHHRGSVQFD